jgi:hypothetical protein
MAKKRWTNKEDDVIENGIKAGLTYKEIAAALPSRTESAVSNRAHIMREKYSRSKTRRNREPEVSLEAIRSIADDNRIWIGMVSASIAAFCSLLTLLICIGAMFA